MKLMKKILIAVLAVVFAVSLSHVIRICQGYRQGAEDYSAAQDIGPVAAGECGGAAGEGPCGGGAAGHGSAGAAGGE